MKILKWGKKTPLEHVASDNFPDACSFEHWTVAKFTELPPHLRNRSISHKLVYYALDSRLV